jgi:hypothetical protein
MVVSGQRHAPAALLPPVPIVQVVFKQLLSINYYQNVHLIFIHITSEFKVNNMT